MRSVSLPLSPRLFRTLTVIDAGNGSLFNYNGNSFGAGAVGKEGLIVGSFQSKKQVLLRVDPLTEEPARDERGLCIRVREVLSNFLCASR